jgi:hypothetical protein
MAQLDPVIFREIPVIEKIIRDETWYESERRGCAVQPDDPVVCENVCEIILRIGRELHEGILAQIAAHPGPVMIPIRSRNHPNDRAA